LKEERFIYPEGKRMKKILVTGSLGYIGSVLVPYLGKYDYDCTGIDAGFFRDCTLFPAEKESTVFKDTRDITKDDLKNIDVVVHLAGIANDPLKTMQPEKVYDPVRKYSYKLGRMCRELGVKLIFASSCSVYGSAPNEISDEKSKPNPVTPYSLNKMQIEGDLEKLSNNDFRPIILRFATVFGLSPRIRFDIVVNMFVGMAASSGKIVMNSTGQVWRPFLHIQDACKAIRYGIEAESDQNPFVLNVGDTNENYQIITIAQIVKDAFPGSEITFLSGKDELIEDRKITDGADKRDYNISFEKIREKFKGFSCDWTVVKGVQELKDGFSKLELTETNFRDINYYRLQKMEYLLQNGYLADDLTWKEDRKQ